jgi:cellulose biosynthesis protein BcsQ
MVKKSKTISFYTGSLGVGASTTIVNLALALGLLGKKVLVIDASKYETATKLLGLTEKDVRNKNLSKALRKKAPLENAILNSPYSNLVDVIIHSNNWGDSDDRETELIKLFSNTTIQEKYDIILIDNYYFVEELALTSLKVADFYLIPYKLDINSIENIPKITELGLYIKRTFNPKLENLGCLTSLVRKSSKKDAKIFQKINELPLDKSNIRFLKTIIPKYKISNPNEPIIKCKPDVLLSKAYKKLADEILELLSNKNISNNISRLPGNNPILVGN